MRIQIVTPAPRRSTLGNRITAERWAKILKQLGHHVSMSVEHEARPADMLIALHARRSHSFITRFRRRHPHRPIVLALTGTDVYRDIHKNLRAQRSLDLADRIVVLQPYALREMSAAQRRKARVIYQSVARFGSSNKSRRGAAADYFEICVIGHLRAVKDPFRAALAARRLPNFSRIRVTQSGGALTKDMEQRALRERQINLRYRWLGELSHTRALRLLADCRLCVISSRIEGGANVLGEAIVAGVPVLASRIGGNLGILGENYPGVFDCGDTGGLRDLMLRAETDSTFMKDLKSRIKQLAPLFDSAREQQAWAGLLAEF